MHTNRWRAALNRDWIKAGSTTVHVNHQWTRTGPSPGQEWITSGPEVTLINANSRMKPTLSAAPGRSTRKARQYGSDIRRLRSQGCTFEAIRAALAEVGISVSKSTVQREAARTGCAVVTAPPESSVAALTGSTSNCPDLVQLSSGPAPTAGASGKEVADAFFERNHFNPLLPKD